MMRALTDSELDAVAGAASLQLNLQGFAALAVATGTGATVKVTRGQVVATSGAGTDGFAFGLVALHLGGTVPTLTLNW
jgi:hypothetical protein